MTERQHADNVLSAFALTIHHGRMHRDDEPKWFLAMTHHPGYECPWADITEGQGAALAETVDKARRHAAMCRSSDHSGRPGEATPDDVSRETSSKGCTHPADEPCFGGTLRPGGHDCPDCPRNGGIGFQCTHRTADGTYVADGCDWCKRRGYYRGQPFSAPVPPAGRTVNGTYNCLRYTVDHERHVWSTSVDPVWYQCDGTPAKLGKWPCP